MTLNDVLVWLVAVGCGVPLLRGLGSRRGFPARGWLAVLAGILVLLGVAVVVRPGVAGYVGTGPWVLFVMIPSFGARAMTRLLLLRRYGAALAVSRLLAVLHPFDGWREQPRQVRAMQRLDDGQVDEGARRLTVLRQVDATLGRAAALLQARSAADWARDREWVESSADRERLLADPTTRVGHLRALGETGARGRMLLELARLDGGRDRAHAGEGRGLPPFHAALARMQAAALCGEPETVRRLCEGPLSVLPSAHHELWLATAEQAAGRPGDAEARLAALSRATASGDLRREIDRRRAEPVLPPGPDELDASARAALDDLVEQVAHEHRFAALDGARSSRRPVATWGLAAVLSAVFAVEVSWGDGSQDPATLLELGALVVPVELTPGEWWRRLTAGFLHFGPLHFVMNTLGLLLIGRLLERAWGARRFLLAYVLSTVVSIGVFPWIEPGDPERPSMLVGASGGLMGIVGGLLGFLVVGHLRRSSPIVRKQLGLLVLIVVLQTAFDLSTPQVSFVCHTLGLLSGAVIGLVVGRRMRA